MTQYEQITQSPEALGAFLAALPIIHGPWDTEFQARFCAGCAATDCDACPHTAERNNPGWWLTIEAGNDQAAAEPGTVVIDLDPAGPKGELTADEEAELKRLRPMFRYSISDSAELTEKEISEMEATEEEKAVCRFLAKSNPEKRVIEITPCGGTSIMLHGAADMEWFISAIREHSREAFAETYREVKPEEHSAAKEIAAIVNHYSVSEATKLLGISMKALEILKEAKIPDYGWIRIISIAQAIGIHERG